MINSSPIVCVDKSWLKWIQAVIDSWFMVAIRVWSSPIIPSKWLWFIFVIMNGGC